MLLIGKGNTTFIEKEGNFDIKDDVREKVPLRHYTMTQTKDGIEITLSDRDGTQVRYTSKIKGNWTTSFHFYQGVALL